MKNYPKLSNLHGYNVHMFALLISELQENDLVFCQKSQIKNVPCTNPMGIRECCPLFQYGGWGKGSVGTAPTARISIICMPEDTMIGSISIIRVYIKNRIDSIQTYDTIHILLPL